MGAPERPSAADLTSRLRAEPYRFRFTQAVRLLALAAREAGVDLRDDLPPGLRFTTPASLSFPPSEVMELLPRELSDADAEALTDDALSMRVAFLGLTGPSAALPAPYTELLIERRNHYRDESAHAFFDIFSHRAIALFYAASQKYRFHAPIELGKEDGFSRNLLDLAGVGLQSLRNRLVKRGYGIPDRFLMYYAGLLAQKPISANALVNLVHGFFKVPVELEQFVGTWIVLGVEDLSRIGGNAMVLGQTAVSGARQFDRQTKLALRLGPLPRERFAEFLPGQPGALALSELVKFCVGHALAVDVVLVLKREDIPVPQLAPDAGLRLGYNAWLQTQAMPSDRSDTRFTLQI
ncbi:MAG: type VI secretion system baseplate subunit TssG [Hydrogenophilales bacterium]|nr:type VI secretion system baseplate subunit TssG [Hydrogenophilales bacterium]